MQPLCEYIPVPNRKESYTAEELRGILYYARRVYYGYTDFNQKDSIELCSSIYKLGQFF